MAGLVVENLSKVYRSGGRCFKALNDINLEIEEGEFVSVLGESGSGKSTLARIILGLESPSSGSVKMDGRCIFQYRTKRDVLDFRRKVQAVFQDSSGTLNPKLSVYSNITESLNNLTDLNPCCRRERIHELMKQTNMELELLKRPIRKLSGGEQRRLSLLRALSINPRYLVIDEVMSGLDFISADAVMNLLRLYKKRQRCGCLFITHDKKCAYRLSDRIIVLKNGSIVHRGVKTI